MATHQHRRIPFRRIVTAIITIILVCTAALLWILNAEHVIQGDWSTILSTAFTALGLIFALLTWLFPFSADQPEVSDPPPLSEPKEDLRLVDLSIIEDSPLPKLDFKLRNIGTQVAFLKRAEFKVLDVAEIYSCDRRIVPITGALAVPSAVYDIKLSPELKGMSKSVHISQSLAPNNIDRFQFILTQDWRYPRDAEIECRWYYLKIVLVYNDTDQVVETRPLLLKLDSLPPENGAWSSVERTIEQRCIDRNKQVIQALSKLEAIRSFSVESTINTLLRSEN